MTVGTPIYPNYTRESGSTYKGRLDDVAGVHRRLAGPFAPFASVQFDFIPGDVSTANDTIARADHGLFASDKGRFTTTGTLPAPLALATDYYVLASGLTSGVFKVSASDGGAAVNLTDTGSGTHTFTRTANLKAAIAKGFIWNGTTLTEVAAQQTAALTAPAANPRIDRLVVSDSTGALSVITGAEAASPSAPALTANKIPVAQIAWIVGQTQIVNADLTDERVLPPAAMILDGTPDADHSANGPATSTFASSGSTTVMDLVYLNGSGEWAPADADAAATSGPVQLAISLETKTAGQAMKVALPGSFVRDDTWNWTPGTILYVSETAGQINATGPSGVDGVVRIVGHAVTADVIFFNPPADYVTIDANGTIKNVSGIAPANDTQSFVIAASDETTAITTGTAKVTFRMPYAFTVTAVRASLSTASTSGLPQIDINEGGTTILSTAITIDANEKTSTTAATPPVISDSSLADDAEIIIDIDAAGTGAKGLKVEIVGRRT